MTLTIDELATQPYATLICYPRFSKGILSRRLKEMLKLGLTSLEFVGEKQLLNVRVLGKGCVGVVVGAHKNSQKIALKIRRVDADRSTMCREACLLKKANSVNVGPRLLGSSHDFLLMQLIDGVLLPEWLKNHRRKTMVRDILLGVLEQCWRLDEIGLDHGELSHAPKHVVVDGEGRPFIVDFETASLVRRPSNVTSICQFLFIGSETAKMIDTLLVENKKAIIQALRRYKLHRARDSFDKVLEACKLQTT